MSKFVIVIDEQAPGSLDLAVALYDRCESAIRLGVGEYKVTGEPATIAKITEEYPDVVLKCEEM